MRSIGLFQCFVAALTLTSGVVAASLCTAAPATGQSSASPVIQVDWQGPLALPPRFRNHCVIDWYSGRPYCSDHCGVEYQFYYCNQIAFGCCRIGFGYCDWRGQLRCHP
jgi:hypothetical protein